MMVPGVAHIKLSYISMAYIVWYRHISMVPLCSRLSVMSHLIRCYTKDIGLLSGHSHQSLCDLSIKSVSILYIMLLV